MGLDQPTDQIQLPCAEPVRTRQTKRLQLKLAGLAFPLDVYVWGVAAVEAGEEDRIRSGNSLDSWHPGLASSAVGPISHPTSWAVSPSALTP